MVVDFADEVVRGIDVVVGKDVLVVDMKLDCKGTASIFGRGIGQLSFSDPRPCGMASAVHSRRLRRTVRREIGL